MKTMTVYLLPHSSFRGSRPPRSDTLFGAICWGFRLLFGEDQLVNLLNGFHEQPLPFLVSSLFEYTDIDNSKTHYLPKPLAAPYFPEKFSTEMPSLKDLETLKKLHKIRIVVDRDFTQIINGEKTDTTLYEELAGKGAEDLQQKRTMTTTEVPHSAINRLTGTVEGPRFFYTEELTPTIDSSGQTGLFFCVKYQEQYEEDLTTVLHFLADKGIGGGASVGKGHIKSLAIAYNYLPYEEPQEETDHLVTLSLTFPDASLREMLSKSWYAIERRQGKIECMYANPEHVWKDHLIMLKEGSTFPQNRQKYYGENRVVRKHDDKLGFNVQHYGYAFTVNTKHVKT